MSDESQPATKGDLAATAESLKSELRGALRSDIEAIVSRLVAQIWGDLTGRITLLENRMESGFVEVKNEVAKFGDYVTRKIEVYDKESLTTPELLDEHGRDIAELKSRVSKLEQK